MDFGSAFQGAFGGSGSGYDFGSKDQDEILSGNVGDTGNGWSGNSGNTTVNFGDNPFMSRAGSSSMQNYLPHLAIAAGVIAVALIVRGK